MDEDSGVCRLVPSIWSRSRNEGTPLEVPSLVAGALEALVRLGRWLDGDIVLGERRRFVKNRPMLVRKFSLPGSHPSSLREAWGVTSIAYQSQQPYLWCTFWRIDRTTFRPHRSTFRGWLRSASFLSGKCGGLSYSTGLGLGFGVVVSLLVTTVRSAVASYWGSLTC